MQILTHLVPSLVLSGFFVAKHTTKGPVDSLKRSVFLHPANCILRKRNAACRVCATKKHHLTGVMLFNISFVLKLCKCTYCFGKTSDLSGAGFFVVNTLASGFVDLGNSNFQSFLCSSNIFCIDGSFYFFHHSFNFGFDCFISCSLCFSN